MAPEDEGNGHSAQKGLSTGAAHDVELAQQAWPLVRDLEEQMVSAPGPALMLQKVRSTCAERVKLHKIASILHVPNVRSTCAERTFYMCRTCTTG